MAKPEDVNSLEEAPAKLSHRDRSRRRVKSSPPSFARRILSIGLRLFVWYSLFTAFFRCPSSLTELDHQSPRVCKPYLVARSQLEPHIAPYYQAYAAQYVDSVRPYAHSFHEKIYTPTADLTTHGYNAYVVPGLEKCQRGIDETWGVLVSPHLQALKDSYYRLYGSSVEPYIIYTGSLITPRYKLASYYFTTTWKDYLAPIYLRSKPVIDKAYFSAHDFVARTLVPYSAKGWRTAVTFINGTARPFVARLYFENVEPQLLRIGEKLASYREGRKGKNETTTGTSTTPVAQPRTSVPVTSAGITPPSSAVTSSSTSQSTPSRSTSSRSTETAHSWIGRDLKAWQERFVFAADKGCEDLEQRVSTIVKTFLENGNMGDGERLVSTLETVAKHEFDGLRAKVGDIVRSLPEEPSAEDEEAALLEFETALKSSGMAIRESAHSLRKWFSGYDSGLVQVVNDAVASTLDVLDKIRDLGLQELGMRWTRTDGVTYKDWVKFYALKDQFFEWRAEVNDVAMQHNALLEARTGGEDILFRGMRVAEMAARELLDLKEIGKFKILSGDQSDDFNSTIIDPAKIRVKRPATEASEAPPIKPRGDAGAEQPDPIMSQPSEEYMDEVEERLVNMTESIDDDLKLDRSSDDGDAASSVESPSYATSDAQEDHHTFAEPDVHSESQDSPDTSDSAPTIGGTSQSSHNAAPPSSTNPSEDDESTVKSSGSAETQTGSDLPPRDSLATEASSSAQASGPVSQSLDPSPEQSSNEAHEDTDSTLLEQQDAIESELLNQYGSFASSTSAGSTSQDPTQAPSQPDSESIDEKTSATTVAPSVQIFKEILLAANRELRSLIDSVDGQLQGQSPVEHEQANSVLATATVKLGSVVASAERALSSAAPTETSTPSETGQQPLEEGLLALRSFSSIVETHLRQLRAELNDQVEDSADTFPSSADDINS